MFKKPVVVNNAHKVSGADRKKLKRALESCMGPSAKGIALDLLLPNKGELEVAKLGSGQRGHIYFLDHLPILMDISGKGDYVPTCYGLWQSPTLLPRITVNHPSVSKFLISGADLMIPGVDLASSLDPILCPAFKEGDPVAICIPGNPAPIGVGTATISWVEIQAAARSGRAYTSGKFVLMLQVYGDYLWSDIGKKGVPNQGFLKNGVVPEMFESMQETMTRAASGVMREAEQAVQSQLRHLLDSGKGDEGKMEGKIEGKEGGNGSGNGDASANGDNGGENRREEPIKEESWDSVVARLRNKFLSQLSLHPGSEDEEGKWEDQDEGKEPIEGEGESGEGNEKGPVHTAEVADDWAVLDGSGEEESGERCRTSGEIAESEGESKKAVAEAAPLSTVSSDAPSTSPVPSSPPPPPPPQDTPWWPASMDQLLEMVMLQALAKTVKDTILPISSSVLWNQHLLPLRPSGSVLDVKHSSYKKLPAFLESLAQRKWIKGKIDKKSGDFVVSFVNRKNAEVADFTPYKVSLQHNNNAAVVTSPTAVTPASEADSGILKSTQLIGSNSTSNSLQSTHGNSTHPSDKHSANAGVVSSSSSSSTSSASPSAASSITPLTIEELLKPRKEMAAVFAGVGANPDALYTAKEAYDIATTYVREKKLDEMDSSKLSVLFDGAMADALFKGESKKAEGSLTKDGNPIGLPKAMLREVFLKRMLPCFVITRGTDQAVKRGTMPVVKIAIQKSQGKKKLTVVTGLEAYFVDPKAFAGEMKKRLATSTTIEALEGVHNHGLVEVSIQGQFVPKVTKMLSTDYGIPMKCIAAKDD